MTFYNENQHRKMIKKPWALDGSDMRRSYYYQLAVYYPNSE